MRTPYAMIDTADSITVPKMLIATIVSINVRARLRDFHMRDNAGNQYASAGTEKRPRRIRTFHR